MSDNGQNGLTYIDVNLNEVDAWDGAVSLVNPGEYLVRCTAVTTGQSQAGKPKLQLTYEVVEAFDEANAEMVGRTIIQSQSLDTTSDAVKGRLKSLVLALVGELSERGGFNPEDFIGAEMECEVVAETYTKTNAITGEPEERNTIKIIRERHPGAEAAPAEPPPKEQTTRGRSNSRGRRSQPRS